METPRKKGKTVHSEFWEIIMTDILACDEESKFSNKAKQTNLQISHCTDISVSTIRRICREDADAGETSLSTSGKHRKCPEERNVNLYDFEKRIIQDTISEFYLVRE